MNLVYSPADVRRTIRALYGPPGWTITLDRCLNILVPEFGLAQVEIPGRLAALDRAGHNREALLAVALAFGIVPEALPREEARISHSPTIRYERG